MTIYGKGCISNYRNCSLCYVWYSVLYRMLTVMRTKEDCINKLGDNSLIITHNGLYNYITT